MWLSEPQADPNLVPDVAEKWLLKTKIGTLFKDFEKYFENVWRISRNTSEIFKNYLGKL